MQGTIRLEEYLTVCLLEDVARGFNKRSKLALLWKVAHTCPAALRFYFNFYRQFSQLIVRVTTDRTPHIILINKGVPQGNPMDMPLYSLSMTILDGQI